LSSDKRRLRSNCIPRCCSDTDRRSDRRLGAARNHARQRHSVGPAAGVQGERWQWRRRRRRRHDARRLGRVPCVHDAADVSRAVRPVRDGRVPVGSRPQAEQAAPAAVRVRGTVRGRGRADPRRGGRRLRAAERVPGHQQPDVRVLHRGHRPDTRLLPAARRTAGVRCRRPGVHVRVHVHGATGDDDDDDDERDSLGGKRLVRLSFNVLSAPKSFSSGRRAAYTSSEA